MKGPAILEQAVICPLVPGRPSSPLRPLPGTLRAEVCLRPHPLGDTSGSPSHKDVSRDLRAPLASSCGVLSELNLSLWLCLAPSLSPCPVGEAWDQATHRPGLPSRTGLETRVNGITPHGIQHDALACRKHLVKKLTPGHRGSGQEGQDVALHLSPAASSGWAPNRLIPVSKSLSPSALEQVAGQRQGALGSCFYGGHRHPGPARPSTSAP